MSSLLHDRPLPRDLFTGVVHFVAVAETGSFKGAAEKMGMSTAAVSKAVRKLETSLGTSLFERTTRTVHLTPAGHTFLRHCKPAVSQIGFGRQKLAESQAVVTGTLTIAIPPVLADDVVPALKGLGHRAPGLHINLKFTDRLIRPSVGQADGVDVALRLGPSPLSDVHHRRLTGPAWVTVASPAYLAAHGTPDRPKALEGHRRIGFVGPDGKPRRWVFRDATTAAIWRVTPTPHLTADLATAVLACARADLGIAQVFRFMARPDLASGQLVEVLDAASAPGPELSLVWADTQAEKVQLAIAHLTAHFGATHG